VENHNHKASEQDSLASYSLRSFNGQATKGYVRALTGAELASRMEKSITDADLIEECYFVPATANGWVRFLSFYLLQIVVNMIRLHFCIVYHHFIPFIGCTTRDAKTPSTPCDRC